jgi:hypothetical protein
VNAPARGLALALAAALVLVFGVAATMRAAAAVQPDPGNAAAWAGGLALLADPPGGLALFDQPARLFPAGGARHAVGVARARPFGFEPLARARAGVATVHGALGAGLGFETFGPPGARRTRLALAVAWRAPAPDRTLALGVAWHEARRDVGLPGARARSGALDAGVVLEGRSAAAALALRSLLSGGAAVARADPDWTAEARLDAIPARLFAALTHDLGGTRVGGGASFASGPLVIRAGAFGAPWTWTLGVSLARGRATFTAARSQHPRLGAGDAWDGGLAW